MCERCVDAKLYSELLVKECSHKTEPIPGLAFSDSFVAVESRINALINSNPEKRGFALFTGVICALLLAAFARSYAAPAEWYQAGHPKTVQFDVFVSFEDENGYDLISEHEMAFSNGDTPVVMPDRPGREIFEGAIELRDDRTIVLDRVLLHSVLSGLERNGAKADAVHFAVYDCYLTADRLYCAYESIFLARLTLEMEAENFSRYQTITPGYNNFENSLYLFAAHWL
jgi:hypothetical protein